MTVAFWGTVFRLLEVTAHAAPTLLVGFLVAGVLKRLLGYEMTKQLFGGSSLRSIPQSWLIGMLLPVCSLGALPVIRQLHKAGVPGGAILAFAISAPLFNPISLLYGLSLSNPLVILTFATLSLLIVTIVGLLIEKVFPFPPQPSSTIKPVSYGVRRMLAVGHAASREAYSGILPFVLLGLLGSALLSFFLPYGYLQDKAERTDVWAPLFMAAVSLPVYETPMTMIIKLGDMFQHGNSVGAAFALMILGAGINAGVFLWLTLNYGKLRTFGCVGTLFAIVVVLSYLVDAPLTPTGVSSAGHTHAFDVYCCPFHPSDTVGWTLVSTRFSQSLQLYESASMIGLIVLILSGWLLSRPSAQGVEPWLEQEVDRTGTWDVELSPQVLGLSGLVGLVAASVLGCYMYYPPVEEIFEELKDSQIPLASAGVSQDWEGVAYWLPIVDDWSRRVQVSAYLRGVEQSEFHAMQARVFREKLDLIRHAAEEKEPEVARQACFAMQKAFSRLKAAYLPQERSASLGQGRIDVDAPSEQDESGLPQHASERQLNEQAKAPHPSEAPIQSEDSGGEE
jgi:uncharacterized membrane protein YraQ (UPF0718 family)